MQNNHVIKIGINMAAEPDVHLSSEEDLRPSDEGWEILTILIKEYMFSNY